MKKQLSIYLDGIRVLAALFVFLEHSPGYTGGFLWRLSGFGHQAVMFFFVLSGFVISQVVADKEKDAAEYAVSRAARIYSVALPALALTIVLFYIGKHIDPSAYPALKGKLRSPGAMILAALFFANQCWAPTVIFANVPYWSLGYEVPYYVFFGLWMFATGRNRWLWIALCLMIMGPSVCMDLPIWLMGVACQRAQARWKPGSAASAGLYALSIPLLILFIMPSIRDPLEAASHAWLGPWAMGKIYSPAVHFAPDYLLGGAVALHLFAFAGLCHRLTIPEPAAKAVRALASCTFSLYLFHLPLLAFMAILWPHAKHPGWNFFGCLILTPALIFLLAQVTEKRKSLYKRWLRKGFAQETPVVVPG